MAFEAVVAVVEGAGVLPFEFELEDCTLESWLVDIFVLESLVMEGCLSGNDAELY